MARSKVAGEDAVLTHATQPADAPARESRVQSLDRALDVLEALAVGGEHGLSDLSGRVGLHPSTVHRLLSVLVVRGYARPCGGGRYALGAQALRLAAGAAASQSDLGAQARPLLRALAERSGETTNLLLPLDDAVVYVDQVASRHMVRMFTQLGAHAPLYCTAGGKAILAARSAADLEAYLARTRLTPRTAHTLTTPAVLAADLDAVRERGYSVDEGEMEDGVRCVAAPVLDASGHAVAALSISGPASRFSAARIEEILPALLAATAELSARLGHVAMRPATE